MAVAQFFEGKNIFVTGGTGFMGKILIEKLLRSCPGVGNIYALLRPKRGHSVEERLQQLLDSEVFDKIKKDNPEVLNKVICIKGNVEELNLGMSQSDREMLVDNVNIIYHSAASVRFDDFLEKSILMNIRGTREIAQLALDLKNPTMFVHISTSYCTGDRYEVDEQLYPPHGNWRDAILLAETCDKELLHTMTVKYIHPHVNTYTYAKGLAEHVVDDMCKGKIKTIITRPSIVVNALHEPIEGWNDNFNGPVGLMLAGGKGFLRKYLGRYDNRVNYIPVDIVVKAIILATYDNFMKTNQNEVEVYNISQRLIHKSLGDFNEEANEMSRMYPIPNLIWYPRSSVTACSYNYYLQVIFFHLLPAVFLDMLLKLVGKEPKMVKIQRKIYIANVMVSNFTIPDYIFNNDKMISMQKNLTGNDPDFSYPNELTPEEIFHYLVESQDGAIRYVLKESIDPTRETERRRLRRFKIADIVLRTFIFCFSCWFLLVKMNLSERIINGIYNYFQAI